MSSSQKWLDQKFSSIKSPFHFFHHCWRERKGVGRWTSCLGPCWPCIFKQAKSRSSPFFSEAIYPPKSMFTVQQPGKNEKFRPGSYLSPPSNAAYYFTANTFRVYGRQQKLGTQKAWQGLVSWEVCTGRHLVVCSGFGPEQPEKCLLGLVNAFISWHTVAVDCCGDSHNLVMRQVEDGLGYTAEQHQVWKMKYSDLLQTPYLPTRATVKAFI